MRHFGIVGTIGIVLGVMLAPAQVETQRRSSPGATTVERTLRVGIRSGYPDARMSIMPAFGRDHLLTSAQIGDVTEQVIAMSSARTRLRPDMRAAARGALVYQEQCAVCHGATGSGDRNRGAPSLQDDVWLYGGSRDEIRRQIELGRAGVMPEVRGRWPIPESARQAGLSASAAPAGVRR